MVRDSELEMAVGHPGEMLVKWDFQVWKQEDNHFFQWEIK